MTNGWLHRSLFGAFAWFFCLLAPCALAQGLRSEVPQALPDLELHSPGTVFASVLLADGSVVVGGAFASLDGTARTHLAKFNADGSLAAWAPLVAGGTVSAMVVDSGGNLYLGGRFSAVNGSPRAGLAKFLADGSLDTNWDPALVSTGYRYVHALALDDAAHLIVGGQFDSIDGAAATANLARVATTGSGTVDTTWTPAPDGTVRALAFDPGDGLFVGGDFANIGGQARSLIAKLEAATGLADATWDPAPSTSGAYDSVRALALDGAGHLYVGGVFTAIGGQARNSLAKLSTGGSGAADADWDPSPSWAAGPAGVFEVVESLALAGTQLYVGGYFTAIGGQSLTHVARVSVSGAGNADPLWNPAPDFYVYTISVNGSEVFLGGTFLEVGGARHWGFARVDTSGTVDATAPDMEADGAVYALAVAPDGGLIVGGLFGKAEQVERHNLLRLNPNGSLDTAWSVSFDQYVRALAVAPSGVIYASGPFTHVNGQAQEWIVKISPGGSVDPVWDPAPDVYPNALAVDATGVYLGGTFTSVDGAARMGLARVALAGTGNVDEAWDPMAMTGQGFVSALLLDGLGNLYSGGARVMRIATSSGAVVWSQGLAGLAYALVLDDAGGLYAGGAFTSIASTARGNLARLSASTGAVDPAWAPATDDSVLDLAFDGSDSVYAGGVFGVVDGQARAHLAKIATTGTGQVDPHWNPAPDNWVMSLAMAPAGILYAGGHFAHIGDETRVGLAAFAGDVIFANGFQP